MTLTCPLPETSETVRLVAAEDPVYCSAPPLVIEKLPRPKAELTP